MKQALRRLTPEEAKLITFLVEKAGREIHPQAYLVEDLSDGGMGSLKFHPAQSRPRARRMGRQLLTASYVDTDDVVVSIALNVDDQGDLFELDVWKVDFSAVRSPPEPDKLRDIETLPEG